MKKAANTVLLVGGILDIVLGAILLLCLVPNFLIFAGIFALVARKRQTKELYITTLVFALLSAEPITITGAILAIVDDEEKKEEKPFVDVSSKEVKKPARNSEDFVAKIKSYKELLDDGAITEEEYNKLKEEEFANRE